MQELTFVPSFSLSTSKLSLFNKVFKSNSAYSSYEDALNAPVKVSRLSNITQNSKVGPTRYHDFKISDHARKNMIEKINWLYFMSTPRNKTTITGKKIFDFRINFITLTLPSKQVHNTAVITKECLNQFLVEMKQRFKMDNFIWRLEFQKNGNVHYHIVTDVYTDYYLVLTIWNRIISKLGYVAAYTQKHIFMTLSDYIKEYDSTGVKGFEVMSKRYASGKTLGWKVPNSVDVKSVLGAKKIAFYISKYFSKKEKSTVKCNELDTVENSQGLRLWFCSRSLSKLKKISDFVPNFDIDLCDIVRQAKDLFKVVHQYCITLFFSIDSLPWSPRAILSKILKDYAYSLNYKPSLI
jgi:hypothetical protein